MISARGRERERDEEDEIVRSGTEITLRAEGLAGEMVAGTATLAEIQEILSTDFSGEPYADLRMLETQCMLEGLDPSTGRLGMGPAIFLDGIRAGLSVAEAITRAMVLPSALALWEQDVSFCREWFAAARGSDYNRRRQG
jgi:hypothetical protein